MPRYICKAVVVAVLSLDLLMECMRWVQKIKGVLPPVFAALPWSGSFEYTWSWTFLPRGPAMKI